MARTVIKVLRKEQGKHLITYVLLDDGGEASVFGEAKVGDRMMVYFNKGKYINAERIEGQGEGKTGQRPQEGSG